MAQMLIYRPTFITITTFILLTIFSLLSVPAAAAPQFGRPYLHVLEQGQRFNGSEIRPSNISVTSTIVTTIGTEVITSTVITPGQATASSRPPVNVSGALGLRADAAVAMGAIFLVLFAL